MAPEIIKSLKKSKKYAKYDPFKADIYSCGKVLMKLLAITDFENNTKWFKFNHKRNAFTGSAKKIKKYRKKKPRKNIFWK